MGRQTGFDWCAFCGAAFATSMMVLLLMFDSNAASQAGPSAAVAIRLEPAGPARQLEDFMSFAREVGADVLLVPNLETSTVESQTEWFQKLVTVMKS